MTHLVFDGTSGSIELEWTLDVSQIPDAKYRIEVDDDINGPFNSYFLVNPPTSAPFDQMLVRIGRPQQKTFFRVRVVTPTQMGTVSGTTTFDTTATIPTVGPVTLRVSSTTGGLGTADLVHPNVPPPPPEVFTSHFAPGHRMRAIDDEARGLVGVDAVNSFLARPGIEKFMGFQCQINWGSIERTPGVYTWTRLDNMLQAAKTAGRRIQVFVMDKSYHVSSPVNVLPPDVDTFQTVANAVSAKRWTPEYRAQFMDFWAAFAARYDNDPYLDSVVPWGESSLQIPSWTTINPNVTTARTIYRDNLLQLVREMKQVFKHTVVIMGVNHPNEDWFVRAFPELAVELGGCGITWPDSDPDLRNTWIHYAMGKEYRDRIAIYPAAQTGFIACTDTQKVFDMLVPDIGAHGIIWNHQHANCSNYIGTQVIPTVNNNGGAINLVIPSRLQPVTEFPPA